jgi:hypothetical protein
MGRAVFMVGGGAGGQSLFILMVSRMSR